LPITIQVSIKGVVMIQQPDTGLTFKLAMAAAVVLGTAGCGGGGGGDTPAIMAAPTVAAVDTVAPLPTPIAATASTPASPPALASTAASTPAPASTPTPVAALEAASPASGSASVAGEFSCGLNGAAGIEAEILQRVNAVRASGAVCGTTGYAATGALAWNPNLLAAAKGHSADMAQKNYFAHNSLDGRTSAPTGQRSVKTLLRGKRQSSR
jgi:uncharacterized protein YkwD